jgi:site-specific DNA-methyltransferase (adenine-specific)
MSSSIKIENNSVYNLRRKHYIIIVSIMDKYIANNVYLEDCVQGLKHIPDKSAQIIICDCPYNIGKDFNNNSDKQTMEEYLLWCDQWIEECLRVLKDDGTMYIYGFSEILAFIRVRLTCNVRWLIWHYTNKNVPSLKFWQRSHESILCCWKDNKVFNIDDVREPYTETFLKNAAGKQRKATKGRFSKGETETTYNAHDKGALPRDVIKVPALAGGAGKKERVDHPTQKPMELCRKLLLASKQNTTDLVIIPFAGSGSECVACKEFNLPFIAFEINTDYVELCKKRIDNLDDNDGHDEPSTSSSDNLSNNTQ